MGARDTARGGLRKRSLRIAHCRIASDIHPLHWYITLVMHQLPYSCYPLQVMQEKIRLNKQTSWYLGPQSLTAYLWIIQLVLHRQERRLLGQIYRHIYPRLILSSQIRLAQAVPQVESCARIICLSRASYRISFNSIKLGQSMKSMPLMKEESCMITLLISNLSRP
jgi:hypothetical protein